MAFRKAERKKLKLRAAVCGPAKSGKTYSALALASGLGQKIAVIDSERRSAELYAHLFNYDVAQVDPPYHPKKYIQLLKEAGTEYDVVIVDSLSHAWAGAGGILDMHVAATKAMKTPNSYIAWNVVTPQQDALIDAMLTVPCHLIATMRSKMAYEQVESNGQKSVEKLGLAPIQREGVEYEFTILFHLNQNHYAASTESRIETWNGRSEILTAEHGRELKDWLELGISDDPITAEQHSELLAKIAELKIPHDWLLTKCWKKWRASELTTLKESQYTELLAALPSLATKYLEIAA